MIRLVKMTFRPENTGAFEKLFNEVKDTIREFPGCLHVELLQDMNRPEIYFTRSIWESENALEAYRKSELFASTWARTKALFMENAEAWSTEVVATGNAHI